METPQTVLSEIIPAEQQILSTSSKYEPDPEDLSELDTLLADSLAICKKPTNRRIYKEAKQKVDELLATQALVAWDTLENIEVWTMTKCKCGGLGVMTFVRYMQKLKKVGYGITHWETVVEIPAGEVVRFALVTRDVCRCEYCAKLEYEKFQDFQEVVK